ncbi:C-type lectin domain-containing protein [Caenorhabditis elegans]|uniref:C-type lectin domain-containing protein n=1 Tax=Caenorhabditis elegans TaxID=6239 RepID=O45528_CAEEL|nr:C-type lectin domain-containing protein [Caenorhabditis elegans]CAB04414.2 C-type lectin domain-containing protein [Caenorhabditis elegans]|eukprot:NP_507258.2 C-type LECtin [Caenorhabditis elegans]
MKLSVQHDWKLGPSSLIDESTSLVSKNPQPLSTRPPLSKKWSQFLKHHWLAVLIGVISEILILSGAVLLTYYLANNSTSVTGNTASSDIDSSTALSFTGTRSAPANISSCTFGFTYINGKCWRLFTDPQTRENADSACMSYGGSTLVSIKNEQENNAILNFVPNSAVENLWTGLHCKANTTCNWDLESRSTDTNLVYTNFASGLSSNECVYFITAGSEAGKWKSDSCNQTMSFICELPSTIHDDNCDNIYNNHCYLRYDLSYTVAEAQTFCKTKCANLVSINSANENRYVQSIYNDTNGYIQLGAMLLSSDDIYWLDGSLPVYNNIKRTLNGNCLFMSVSKHRRGFWYTVECTQRSWFLCKRPAGIVC